MRCFRILEGARLAPSGNNKQPWHFIVVRDRDKKEKIAQACYGQSFVSQAAAIIVCKPLAEIVSYDGYSQKT